MLRHGAKWFYGWPVLYLSSLQPLISYDSFVKLYSSQEIIKDVAVTGNDKKNKNKGNYKSQEIPLGTFSWQLAFRQYRTYKIHRSTRRLTLFPIPSFIRPIIP
jgi:hypothetical protein